jgi:hypothetical protein
MNRRTFIFGVAFVFQNLNSVLDKLISHLNLDSILLTSENITKYPISKDWFTNTEKSYIFLGKNTDGMSACYCNYSLLKDNLLRPINSFFQPDAGGKHRDT